MDTSKEQQQQQQQQKTMIQMKYTLSNKLYYDCVNAAYCFCLSIFTSLKVNH